MKSKISITEIIEGLQSNPRKYLSKAITLVESTHPADKGKAWELLKSLPKIEKKSFRIAITGSPGVGKSSFIEAIGDSIASEGKLAVLSIDPSSEKGGSILGDKTRMTHLMSNNDVYIRPSASGSYLGGIEANTAMSIVLCEVAGYENIIIETVGVGQSELEVRKLSDCVILLLQPHTGDELQGIKKGIMEIADLIVINKADGSLRDSAVQLQQTIKELIHYSLESKTTQVLTSSSIEKKGLKEIKEILNSFRIEKAKMPTERINQNQSYWKSKLETALIQKFFENKQITTKLLDEMSSFQLKPEDALNKLLNLG